MSVLWATWGAVITPRRLGRGFYHGFCNFRFVCFGWYQDWPRYRCALGGVIVAKINNVLVSELGQMIMTALPRTVLIERVTKYREAGLSEKRFLWDCLWSVPYENRTAFFGKVYAFENDNHITTALKSWFKSTGLTY